MTNNTSIQLVGSMKEQANQLYSLLETKELSVEALDKIVPMGTGFIKEFSDVLKGHISSKNDSFKRSVAAMETVMSKLADAVKDDHISNDERREILETIKYLGDNLRQMQENKNKQDSRFECFLTACAVIIIGILGGLASSKRKN